MVYNEKDFQPSKKSNEVLSSVEKEKKVVLKWSFSTESIAKAFRKLFRRNK